VFARAACGKRRRPVCDRVGGAHVARRFERPETPAGSRRSPSGNTACRAPPRPAAASVVCVAPGSCRSVLGASAASAAGAKRGGRESTHQGSRAMRIARSGACPTSFSGGAGAGTTAPFRSRAGPGWRHRGEEGHALKRVVVCLGLAVERMHGRPRTRPSRQIVIGQDPQMGVQHASVALDFRPRHGPTSRHAARGRSNGARVISADAALAQTRGTRSSAAAAAISK